ncbi:hypothetical protein ACLB2K_029646 [Fragaria x ananassa]
MALTLFLAVVTIAATTSPVLTGILCGDVNSGLAFWRVKLMRALLRDIERGEYSYVETLFSIMGTISWEIYAHFTLDLYLIVPNVLLTIAAAMEIAMMATLSRKKEGEAEPLLN